MAGNPGLPAAAAAAASHLVQYQPVPMWHDGSHPYGFVAAAPATQPAHVMTAPPQPEPAESTKKPRPRKPYTATKTREMWSAEEHSRMLEGLKLFKRDWAKVTEFVGTRSPAQVRSHAQKYFDRVARDKTDDYVPQARPKRKSASPYPRKVRSDQQQQPAPHHQPQQLPPHPVAAAAAAHPPGVQYQLQQHAPVPVAIPVDSYATVFGSSAAHQYIPHPAQPQPIAYSVHPQVIPQMSHHPVFHQRDAHPHLNAQLRIHPVTHPALMQQPASPALPTVPVDGASPPNFQFLPTRVVNGVAHPVAPGQSPQLPCAEMIPPAQGHVFGQVPGAAVRLTRVFSPYIGVNGAQANPQMRPPTYNSSPHPSPGTFDGQAYAVHSPFPGMGDPAALNVQHSFYSVLSPLTPAVPYGMVPSPASQQMQGRYAQAVAEKALHVPRHTHPEGPDPNCAKCNALKRFGNVLHEIGALHKSKGQCQTAVEQIEKSDAAVSKARKPSKPVNAEKTFGSPCNTPSLTDPQTSQPPVSVRHISQKYDAARPHHVPVRNVVCLSPSLTDARGSESNLANGLKGKDNTAPRTAQLSMPNGTETAPSNATVVNAKESSAQRGYVDESRNKETCGNGEELASKRRHIRAKVLKARKTQPNSGTVTQNSDSGGDCAASPVTKSVRSVQVVRRQPSSSDKRAVARTGNYGPSNADAGGASVQKRSLHNKECEGSNKKTKVRGATGIEPLRKENISANGSTPTTASYSRSEQKEIFDAVHSLQILGRTPTPER